MTGTPRRPLRIGMTGPIGCGKSTVAGVAGGRPGVLVVDADVDRARRDGPGEPALDGIVAESVRALRPDGTLDRAGLGRFVFADPAALADLEAIIHPAVRGRRRRAIADAESDGATRVVIEAIRLSTAGWRTVATRSGSSVRGRVTGARCRPRAATDDIELTHGRPGRPRGACPPVTTRVVDTSGRTRGDGVCRGTGPSPPALAAHGGCSCPPRDILRGAVRRRRTGRARRVRWRHWHPRGRRRVRRHRRHRVLGPRILTAPGASGAASAVATHGIRRFRKARGSPDQGRWLCGRCRSLNAPGSSGCYRGCGRREAVALLLPEEVARARTERGATSDDALGWATRPRRRPGGRRRTSPDS